MKRIIAFFMLAASLFYACTKNNPASPSPANTPDVQATVAVMLTAAVNANATLTHVASLYSPTVTQTATLVPAATITFTATATPNMTETIAAVITAVGAANATATEQALETQEADAALFTATITITKTASPDMTQTIAAILTAVGAGNATATEQAMETAAADAALYTPTFTSTATPSPNQTATAAAVGTMVADIYASETEAVILSRTPTPTVTSTITQTWTDTFTYTVTTTFTFTFTETPTYTVTCTSTATATETLTSTSTPTTIPYSEIVPVPGGTFTQIDALSVTNKFDHTIASFKMGKYLVTYDLWYVVRQWAVANGYIFQNAGTEGKSGIAGAAPTAARFQPVDYISWRDAMVWCNAYNEKTGLSPVYCSDAGFTVPIRNSVNGTYVGTENTAPGAFDNPFVNWSSNGYRLPTEGEYQYAACYIDGTNWTPYNYASGASDVYTNSAATAAVGWNGSNAGHNTKNVGALAPNVLGIYDMSGDVLEMCWDWIGFTYPVSAMTDYRGPAASTWRVMRGGDSVDDNLFFLQVGCRNYVSPDNASIGVGFRLAKSN